MERGLGILVLYDCTTVMPLSRCLDYANLNEYENKVRKVLREEQLMGHVFVVVVQLESDGAEG